MVTPCLTWSHGFCQTNRVECHLLRALVISDTHFGAWTGEDILREPETIALLEPHLDVDEVIFLGDMFDLLFGSVEQAFTAAGGLLDLLRERLQGRRFVFLAGNHDHHFVTRQAEALLELELATGKPPEQLDPEARRLDALRWFLEHRLEGVEIDIRYPTYTFGPVLCTHGHYLDFYARRSGSGPSKLLARVLWEVAVGGSDEAPTVEDYEATITMLTGLLFTIAQLPNGTRAQRRAFRGFQTLGRSAHLGAAPVRLLERAGLQLATKVGAQARGRSVSRAETEMAAYRGALSHEQARRRRTGAPAGGEATSYAIARRVRPSDPSEHAVEAFERVVDRVGWGRDTDQIVFAHTHQPLAGVIGPGGRVRYWNTGSWIYEPDLSSNEAYISYLRNAWPGAAVVIDTDAPEPRLLRLRDHLNPLHQISSNGNLQR
jgi:UDP-2,3-diacylglucosamine pyrophosphatase LpxH